MKKLIIISSFLCAYTMFAFDESATEAFVNDQQRFLAIEKSLEYVTPNKTVILMWLRLFSAPEYKVRAAQILKPFMTHISRAELFHACLSSLRSDSQRLIFIKSHLYNLISAQNVADIINDFESMQGKLNALAVIMARVDDVSKILIRDHAELIAAIFHTHKAKMQAAAIISPHSL